MPLGVLAAFCALLGLAVGSFLNVVIYRVPRDESIVSPGSACPDCGTPILNRDNVPVISWLALRGRCRSCGRPISVRYPVVEATTSLLFLGAALRYGYDAALPALLVLLAGLFALACIDLELRLLPRKIVYPLLGMVAVLLLAAAIGTGDYRPLWIAAACSVGWFLVFYAINRLDQRLLGFGDVRLALVLGLGLGWLGVTTVLLGFFAANVLGAVVGLTLIAAKRMRRDQPIPYGVFLAIGAALAIFVHPTLHLHLRGV
ncbi:MAG TPA: prepilin peptidase [Acidimicrobiales bacterium]|jgi:leader peptidase (prepilin peptidase)/N-methyltransferase|nr:prepilin peptidase [Acidimicrobiales bacterium]